MDYDFRKIEGEWQKRWAASGIYTINDDFTRPKYYVLDMFPYPSGAGLHVGHPLGYIASDIYSRYKRLKGFNVLHPMGFDSFGLPAEQYALETGQHPAVTTKNNIATFKNQLEKIGFCYDWSREVQTSDPGFYKWTQWIFLQLFNSYYDKVSNSAKPIEELIKEFQAKGSSNLQPPTSKCFSAEDWAKFDEKQQQDILMDHRLAFCGFGEVNWCEGLGTVLANDEVVNGVSERGGYPVEKRKMRQWFLRITDYADRLLDGLETVDFSDAMKEMQRNWIGRSEGAEMDFTINGSDKKLRVYTTRADTIFGVDFMVMAPEHELVGSITSEAQQPEIDKYLSYIKSRSDRERQSEVKHITGCFTGAYALNPFDGRAIPIWIAEYVLAGYGTGAIMAVPCGDQRDFAFATHFNIPITNIIGDHFNGIEANSTKEAVLKNSGFLNGMIMKDAIKLAIDKIVEQGIGKKQVNFRMRDAGFSRQRYWGEPFPIIWSDGIARPLNAEDLPLELPHVEKYGPGPNGEGPLANLKDWINLSYEDPSNLTPKTTPNDSRLGVRETSTMPGYAGSSWYFLRYMDPHNDQTFCDRKISDYWGQVDLYVGGTEHAVGHLLYSRMWTKVLYDLGYIGFDEPFKKLLNQGMIQGSSRFVYKINWDIVGDKNVSEIIGTEKLVLPSVYVSKSIADRVMSKKELDISIENILNQILKHTAPNLSMGVFTTSVTPLHVDIKIVDGFELDIEAFRIWRPELKDSIFICEDEFVCYPGPNMQKSIYISGREIEKMSKSKFNTENPDDLVLKYGADTFRMYEMFLGPVESSKPWDTKGIEGVHRFLKKLWRLFFDEQKGLIRNGDKANEAELKILHRTIKKIEEDTERFSFNTAVSTFMIAVNELTDIKCHKKELLEKLLILIAPYAPHIAEELWNKVGNEGSVLNARFPVFDPTYLLESTKEYPISINGKLRTNISMALDLNQQQVEEIVLQNEIVIKWLEGNVPKKIILVKNKMVNVVV